MKRGNNPLRVLHLAGAFPKVGAGAGALLTHEALLRRGLDSRILFLKDPEADNDRRWSFTHLSHWHRLVQRFVTSLERAPVAMYRQREDRLFSTGFVGLRLERLELFRWADVIHLHWVNHGLVNVAHLARWGKPLVWTLRDMWPFTGGCKIEFPTSKLIAASLWLFFISSQLTAQDGKPYSISGTETYVIHSKINQREYNLAVSVPNNYDKAKKYPVYYLLDGHYAFPIIALSNKILGPWRLGNEIEEVIVVSITGKAKSFDEWLRERWPDYTFNPSIKHDTIFTKNWESPEPLVSGKGDAFLQVIRKEIIPLIENQYSTNQERGISGHSLSGQFVANLLFKANDIFSKFGINSPFILTYNDNEIRRTELAYSNTHTSLKAKIFLSFGGLEKPKEIKDLYEFEALLKKYQGVETKLVIFDDETHVSVIPSMITRCLKYLYKTEKK